ncbi:guanylate kinase [Proteocatella sphenisci]|uniref:guanylate kinase n=1 Tax=Proteocatella sphenisci TaxID=181070 RepID=UPI00048FFB36|nr:guanylate kinase [Proteocatella sphenisci]
MDRKGLLLVLSGPSGAGKGTICESFMKKNKDVRLSVSTTTRKMRTGEVDGISYNFISKDEFEKSLKEDGFLEHVHVFGNYYGTPKSVVEENINKGINVLLEIEIVGAMQIKEEYPDAVLIFVLPPTICELEKRIVKRGTETDDQIKDRLSRALSEIRKIDEYSYFIINKDVDEAVDYMESIIKAEKSNVKRYSQQIINLYQEEK